MFRLESGQDLFREIEKIVQRYVIKAGIILTSVSSLSKLWVRLAGAKDRLTLEEDLKLISLGRTLLSDGCHIHISVSDRKDLIVKGIFMGVSFRGMHSQDDGRIVYSPPYHFDRRPDPRTGYKELFIESVDETH